MTYIIISSNDVTFKPGVSNKFVEMYFTNHITNEQSKLVINSKLYKHTFINNVKTGAIFSVVEDKKIKNVFYRFKDVSNDIKHKYKELYPELYV